MKRVLIVSPNWPPVSFPDLHRVRMALPYFAESGWEPLVLHINPDEQEGLKDPSLILSVPPSTRTYQARGVRRGATEWFGLTSVGWRSLVGLQRDGARIIEAERPDVVFFSTTMFVTTVLGRLWHERFGVPYIVDYQDPWVDDYYDRSGVKPPGGWLKYRASRAIARTLEPQVMRSVSHIISVSPAYADSLRVRYAYLRAEQFTVLPFGAPEADFEMLQQLRIRDGLFDAFDGKQHWVYAGAAGAMMTPALRLLFSALAKIRNESSREWRDVHLHFVGTSYAPQDKAVETVRPIAVECGVGDVVTETTARLPYFEALKAITEATALVVIGSDSASYSASKLYPYVLARRPMLSVLHAESPAVRILRAIGAGEVVEFDPRDPAASLSITCEALENLRRAAAKNQPPRIDREQFSQHTAREMTRRLCAVFNDVAGRRGKVTGS